MLKRNRGRHRAALRILPFLSLEDLRTPTAGTTGCHCPTARNKAARQPRKEKEALSERSRFLSERNPAPLSERSTPRNQRERGGAFVSTRKQTEILLPRQRSSLRIATIGTARRYRDYRDSPAPAGPAALAQRFPSRPAPARPFRAPPGGGAASPRPPPGTPRRGLTWASMGPAGPCPAPGAPWAWPGPACPAPGGVWVWLGRVKSVNSNSEPCVSAPSSSASSVSRKVRVCELGPYASTLMAAAVEKRSGASARSPRLGRAAPHGARAPRYASGGIRRAHQAAPPRTDRRREPRCPARAAPNAAGPTAEGAGAGERNREPRDAARGTVRPPRARPAAVTRSARRTPARPVRVGGWRSTHTWEGTAGGGGAARGRREGARGANRLKSEGGGSTGDALGALSVRA